MEMRHEIKLSISNSGYIIMATKYTTKLIDLRTYLARFFSTTNHWKCQEIAT